MCVCVPGHRSCKYVSMCKCVCFVCDKRGMEEGVKERARSRDSVGRRRRRRKMWEGRAGGARGKDLRGDGRAMGGCDAEEGEEETGRQEEREAVFFCASLFLIPAQPSGLKEALQLWIFHDSYMSTTKKLRSVSCSFLLRSQEESAAFFLDPVVALLFPFGLSLTPPLPLNCFCPIIAEQRWPGAESLSEVHRAPILSADQHSCSPLKLQQILIDFIFFER